jgi:hypothetical protein
MPTAYPNGLRLDFTLFFLGIWKGKEMRECSTKKSSIHVIYCQGSKMKEMNKYLPVPSIFAEIINCFVLVSFFILKA